MTGPAPLVGTAEAPVPEGASGEWFRGADGARLRAAIFAPLNPLTGSESRGSVVVSPGRTEAIEKYFEVASHLTARGFVVLVHDWRGQGLADRPLPDRLLGHATGHADYLDDYRALLATFDNRLPRPWIALGHSMGGCLALLALAEGETRFSAAILSAPMLGLRLGAMPIPVARALARVLTVTGGGRRPTPGPPAPVIPFEANILTHDRARYERAAEQIRACPDLALGRPTWSWLDFAFTAMSVLARAPALSAVRIPVTVVAAGGDLIIDNTPARAVAARLAKGRYVEIPGAYHEVVHETDDVQAVFWREFDALASSDAPSSSMT